ncbi:MAG: hypothetical protein R3B48_23335 [Kofleriaceae bacterium]
MKKYALAVILVTAIGCGRSSNDSKVVRYQVETCVDAGAGSGSGWGSGSGSGCETCECTECNADDAYTNAYNEVFGSGSGSDGGSGSGWGPDAGAGSGSSTDAGAGPDAGAGSGAGSGSGWLASSPPSTSNVTTEVTQDLLDKCNRVSQMTYTSTFNCRDYAGWFLRCLQDNGITGTGLSMFCKNCDDGKSHGHRIVVYPRGGQYCPGDPGWDGEEASGCCKATIAEAEACAHARFCGGTWVNRTTPADRYAGCQPDSRTQRTCAYCTAETCTPEERAQVCKLLNIDDDCGQKTSNSECTACCISKYPVGGDRTACLSDSGCASKP